MIILEQLNSDLDLAIFSIFRSILHIFQRNKNSENPLNHFKNIWKLRFHFHYFFPTYLFVKILISVLDFKIEISNIWYFIFDGIPTDQTPNLPCKLNQNFLMVCA